MPAPTTAIAFNTGSQTLGSLKLNGLEYALSSSINRNTGNLLWRSAIDPGDNFYVFVTSAYTQGYSTYPGGPLFYIVGTSSADITSSINRLPDRIGLPKFTDTGSALQWVAESGKYLMTNFRYPTIVTDKLGLLLNSSFLASYPTTGNKWYDIGGYGYIGSIYSSSYASNSISLPSPGSNVKVNYLSQTSNNITVSFNFKNKGALNSITSSLNNYNTISASVNQSVAKFNNVNCIIEINPTSSILTRKIYLNTVLISENSATSSFYSAGVNPTNINVYTSTLAGSSNIQNISVYQKSLSQDEINQNYYQGNIVTNGLILALDAGNIISYPGPGNTWFDMSGNSKNGTTSGATYGSQNGGVFNFDGVNDTISFGTGNTFFPLTNFTIDLWFQSKGTVPTTGTRPGLFGFTFGIRAYFDSSNSIRFGASSGSANGQELTYTHNTNIRDDSSWNNIVFQATPTNSYIYLNGELKASRSLTWLGDTVWPTNGWRLGRDNNDGFYFFTGSIASYKMYNTALTLTEIQQNYNAFKSRFGL